MPKEKQKFGGGGEEGVWNEKGKMLSLKEREEVGRKKALSG